MGKIIKLQDETDQCVDFLCQDCESNQWAMYIYSLPKRVCLECLECGGYYEMEID
jgi:hypothetical protein